MNDVFFTYRLSLVYGAGSVVGRITLRLANYGLRLIADYD